jgi:hypothetical protein
MMSLLRSWLPIVYILMFQVDDEEQIGQESCAAEFFLLQEKSHAEMDREEHCLEL